MKTWNLVSRLRRYVVAMCIVATMHAMISVSILSAHVDSHRDLEDTATRALPRVMSSRPAMTFSTFPSDQEITAARVFSMPLLKTEGSSAAPPLTVATENQALAQALLAYMQASYADDVSALTRFLARHPTSRWRAGLLAHLGLIYRRSGLFHHSIDAFEAAWALTKHGAGRNANDIANWAVGELADLHANMGHAEQLQALFSDLQGRQLYGPATEQWNDAREWLIHRQHPEQATLCGIVALTDILTQGGQKLTPTLLAAHASHDGMSMYQVGDLARQAGLQLRAAKRQAGTPIPVPAVMHWTRGHYSAVVDRREQDGQAWYWVENPLSEASLWISQAVLDTETSGYFLIPTGELPVGWQWVSATETEGVWGKCPTGRKDKQRTTEYDQKIKPDAPACGMAVYNFHAMLASLNIVDEPLGYTPPLGPSVTFRATYNQREAFQPAIFQYTNLGPKWTFDFISYVTDRGPTLRGGPIIVYLRGGGQETYIFRNASDVPQSGGIDFQSQAELVVTGESRTNVTRYERRLPDGSKEIFAQPDGTTGQGRRVFLSQIVDPAGNAVNLSYDDQMRVVAVTDAIGQVSRMAYELPNDPLKITQITDPFGRSAHFRYDTQGQLIQIEDVIGLTSTFTYDNGFINSMATPYGTTTFRTGLLDDDFLVSGGPFSDDLHRWLEATDPLGDTERLEIRSRLQASQPGEPISPVRMLTLHWDKRAWKQGGRDHTKARVFEWMLRGTHVVSGVLYKEKPPLEHEIVYTYPGDQPSPDLLRSQAQGADGLPTAVSRTLEDGSVQTHQFAYTERGYVSKFVDPAGRMFSLFYASNGIDLLEVFRGESQERLARYTYNEQHVPLTFTDAAGQTTTFTYNPQGQLLTATNAKGETTTFTYDERSYLTTVTGAVPEALTRFTYDDFGRVLTLTDSEGYQLALAYDAFDRLTQLTYPDGTFEQVGYDRLDAVALTDRQGRTTHLAYDALRRPISSTDPLGRLTQLQWCDCGSLAQLIDPAGHVTTWDYDLQGRVIAKILADGATTRYVYTPGSGRLQQVIDPNGQITAYAYTIDDNLQRIGFENATVETAPLTFSYDSQYDRVVSVEDGTGTTRYTYHPIAGLGALQLATVTGQLPGSQIDYAYDELGRVITRSINGVVSQVTYDALGRVSQLRNALGDFGLTYAGATGRSQSIAYPNGQQTVFSYFDHLGDQRLRQIRHVRSDETVLSQFDYTYEVTGEIETQGRDQPELEPAQSTYAYHYDAASQLLAAELEDAGGATLATYDYVYDEAGNRTIETVSADSRYASFNPVNQLVALQHGEATREFTYDANGNLLSDGERTFEWDARDRLVAVNMGDHRSEFYYDGFDRRVRIVEKERDAVMSDVGLLWCGDVICEQRTVGEGASQTQKRFFSFGETDGDRAYFYTLDHLGSIRQMIDIDGAVDGSYDYGPYGRVVNAIGDASANFGYAGYYVHAPSQLYLTQYRAYDPNLGRWLSRDPISFAGGNVNLYGYVLNDPVNHTDALGLYEYTYRDRIGNVAEGITPKVVMAALQSNAVRFFPFPIEGSKTFIAPRQVYTLSPIFGTPIGAGKVKVSKFIKDRMFRFTVISDNFFVPKGSTITFSVCTDKEGAVFLVHHGKTPPFGLDRLGLLGEGADMLAGRATWVVQAKLLERYIREDLSGQPRVPR